MNDEFAGVTAVRVISAVQRAVLIGVRSDHVTDRPDVVPEHHALGLDHEVVGVGYSRGNINEIKARCRHGEEEDEGQERAVGHPQQPPPIHHICVDPRVKAR